MQKFMRIWKENEIQCTANLQLFCDICGEEIRMSKCEEPLPLCRYNFVRIMTNWVGDSPHAGTAVDIDVCERCVFEKIIPLTLIEKEPAR